MIKEISLDRVNYGFNNNLFFKNFSLNFKTIGISIIIGPNGSGKSLITKLLKGIIKPTSGKVRLISQNKEVNIGYLSQKIIFFRRDVFSNLAYPLLVKGTPYKEIKKKISKLLKNFDYLNKERLSARSLSKGNQQFLAFIRSQVLESEILILDEPCSNLDFDTTKKIEKYLIEIKKEKKIIMVTHDMLQAMRLADEIIIINNGKLVEVSSKNKILSSKKKFTKNFFTKHFY